MMMLLKKDIKVVSPMDKRYRYRKFKTQKRWSSKIARWWDAFTGPTYINA